MQRRYWVIAGIVVAAVAIYFLWPRPYCRSARTDYDIEVPQCPDGEVRQTLRIDGLGLRRGGKGTVRLWARAHYAVSLADEENQAPVSTFDARLSLVDPAGKQRPLTPTRSPLEPREGWTWTEQYAEGTVALPDGLPDGDYLLRARVASKVAENTVDLPLKLYAPARIHVLTDRPLYEPGQRIKFRALVVRARDLTPIDHRPGTWIVTDPSGTVLLEERAPAGEWGVVAGSFLLDQQAPVGSWTIAWRSGQDSASARVRVEPFTLPRFRVQAAPDQPFHRAGDRPRVSGSVVYSSGAPVQGARVELQWSVQGAWPPPAVWTAPGAPGGLPHKATTDATGAFAVQLPLVPADLQGKVTLNARVAAVDPAGDRVEGATSVLLSEHAIDVSAITPLGGGLIGGFNNRVYLRVTTADGRTLPGARINVRKAWLPSDAGVDAELDDDSVTRLQLDPGPPVMVVIAPLPVRRDAAATSGKVRRSAAVDLSRDEDASLDDQVEMDRWLALLQPCAKWVSSDENEARVALRVSEAGAIVAATARTALGNCVVERVKRRRLPRGRARFYAVTFELDEPDLPRLEPRVVDAFDELPEAVTELFVQAARGARDCLPRKGEGDLPWVLAWRLAPGSRKLTASWMRAAGGGDSAGGSRDIPPGVDRCILSQVTQRSLPRPAAQEAVGVVRYALDQPEQEQEERPQPTMMRGYELLVSATVGDKPLGQTRLRLPPGQIPPLTLRASPVLAAAGTKVELELLRGPGFGGELPRVISVEHLGRTESIKLGKGARKTSYAIPRDSSGWFTFTARGQRALVFVRSPSDLAVAVEPAAPRYAPGATARLRVRTRVGQRPVKAAVGLFGVDQSLGQIAPLPGPEALDGLRPAIGISEKAFGVLDGQALALGRITGEHAAAATVLRVTAVPAPAAVDALVNASASTSFDAIARLTDRFYVALAELHAQARQWEKSAPGQELMQPARLAELWQRALDACTARGQRVDDAYGRRLRLHRLPADLLALTDPRQVVVVGTRLPEDVEDWPAWVARNRP